MSIITIYFKGLPDAWQECPVKINLPIIPIVGDCLDFMFDVDEQPKWVICTREQWKQFCGDGYKVTQRLVSGDKVVLDVVVW